MGPGFAPRVGRVTPRAGVGGAQLDALAQSLSLYGPPIVVFNASHSGSGLLAALLREMGVFMGADLNESGDSLPVFDLVRHLVEAHAPDFSRLVSEGDPSMTDKVRKAFMAHLSGCAPGRRWGWKLPETGQVLPIVVRLFPGAQFIHLVRDGRDVAFSPFVAPKDPFWRKIYFGSSTIQRWNGLGMTQRAYRSHGPLFNAARWVRSVTLGRAGGAMLGERYLEMRYEALVAEPVGELARLTAFLGIGSDIPAQMAAEVHANAVGKWRSRSPSEIAEVTKVLEPTLSSFGYGRDVPTWAAAREIVSAERWSWLMGMGASAGSHANPGGLGGLFRVRDRR